MESARCIFTGITTWCRHNHQNNFSPSAKNIFYWPRSCDMKGGIVAMLFAIRALKECAWGLGKDRSYACS